MDEYKKKKSEKIYIHQAEEEQLKILKRSQKSGFYHVVLCYFFRTYFCRFMGLFISFNLNFNAL